ncbi:hypothetical protein C8J56DRAFT_880496 [Mycena floridula]|nr:hypothetical protein C8J56DRAFT_880496 [Mycena floridula]
MVVHLDRHAWSLSRRDYAAMAFTDAITESVHVPDAIFNNLAKFLNVGAASSSLSTSMEKWQYPYGTQRVLISGNIQGSTAPQIQKTQTEEYGTGSRGLRLLLVSDKPSNERSQRHQQLPTVTRSGCTERLLYQEKPAPAAPQKVKDNEPDSRRSGLKRSKRYSDLTQLLRERRGTGNSEAKKTPGTSFTRTHSSISEEWVTGNSRSYSDST